MRIRSIKPEFWRSDAVNAIPWHVVFDGPRPSKVNDVAPMRSGVEYVYLLFGETDQLLYVGRSFRPADRFSKHCRKPWWKDVSGVVLISVEDERRPGVCRKYYTPPNVSAFESAAIAALNPLHNIARPKVA